MDLTNVLLLSSAASNFFGSYRLICDNETLEATLRYIAIKSNGGDIANAKLINTKVEQANYRSNGNTYTEEAYDTTELLIITPYQRGNDLLTIDAAGWVSLDSPPYPVAALLTAKSSETRIYVNADKKRAVVFVRTYTDTWAEIFASCLFRILPWRFDGDDTETSLMKAIAKRNVEAFQSIINSCCENFDFKKHLISRHLIGWVDSLRNSQINSLKNQLSNYMQSIRNLEQELDNYLNNYALTNNSLIALQMQTAQTDDLFLKFFETHKQLEIHSIDDLYQGGKSLDYCILETIEYFDEENFLNNYNNPNSSFGSCNADMRRILYGIFKEHRGVIRAEAMFRLTNLSSLSVLSGRSGQYNSTHFPHPHLVNFQCLGANKNYINKYMMAGDWDMAIEQSIAAVKNVNMGDSAVMDSMIRDLGIRMDNCSCIIAETGTAMTPRQFLEYLREIDKNEDTENG